MRALSFVVFLSFFALPLLQGQDIQVGTWRSHLPYRYMTHVAKAGAKVFLAGPNSLFRYDKDFGVTDFLDKTMGLNDAGISCIAYHPWSKELVIAYSNGNIDLFHNERETVRNFSALATNRNITGNRSVNDIFCDSIYAYLSCDFGLVVLDLQQGVFRFTTFTPSMQVWGITQRRDTLYLASSQGIYAAPRNGSVNLQDFSQWQRQQAAQGLFDLSYACNSICTWRDTIFAVVEDTVFAYANGGWSYAQYRNANGQVQPFYGLDHPIRRLRPNPDARQMHISTGLQYYYRWFEDGLLVEEQIFGGLVQDYVQHELDQDTLTWFASLQGAVFSRRSSLYPLIPEGPANLNISSMSVDRNGNLWCTGDPVDYIYNYFSRNGIYHYNSSNKTWTQYSQTQTPALANRFDFVCTASHPKAQGQAFGSFLDGLFFRDKDGNWSQFRGVSDNSSLQRVQGDTARTRITGLLYDKSDNLWIANHLCANPISVWRKDGTWQSFSLDGGMEVSHLAMDRNGYLWIADTRRGLHVLDPGDLDDPNDDRHILLNSSNANLGSNTVLSLAADRDGLVWVGTDNGVTIFACGSSVFSGGCTGNRPVVNPDNFNGRLLENEAVNSIAVDGGNRKWIGTKNGVFTLSPDGMSTVHYFTTENSPLPSNEVGEIAIDGKEGYVYIATMKGLVSYRGQATEGARFANKDNVLVFPNPVEPDYEGPIAIRGLVEDVSVKITDVSGLLVYETRSLGGQAVWDARDYTGRRVRSGVYLIFTVDTKTAEQRLATKVVVLN
jgi:ligand-binding sensor domain-containing protein